jgi:hypothetical protein
MAKLLSQRPSRPLTDFETARLRAECRPSPEVEAAERDLYDELERRRVGLMDLDGNRFLLLNVRREDDKSLSL